MAYKTVTIKDIAARLKLAPGTVSKALRNDRQVKRSTRKMVKDAAAQLGYVTDWRTTAAKRKKTPSPPQQNSTEKREITIYDIAGILGISTATVSRALSGSCKVSKNTKKRVTDAAAAMGYIVNEEARELRTRATGRQPSPKVKNDTIYTIAQLLGLSPSTVSRSFLSDSPVSARTKAIVLQAADEMGFIPREHARKLRTNKGQAIGVGQ